MRRPRKFKCTYEKCTFDTSQRNNLTVHKKQHTGEKDQYCPWPDPSTATGFCKFVCSDPSSLNRHVKRHVTRAKAEGKPIPIKISKRPSPQNPRWATVKTKPRDSRPVQLSPSTGPRNSSGPPSGDSTDSEGVQVPHSVLSNSPRPQRLGPTLNTDSMVEWFDRSLNYFDEVATPIDYPIPPPATMGGSSLPGPPYSEERPQTQAHDDIWLGHLPDINFAVWSVTGHLESQPSSAPSIESVLDPNTLHALSILSMRLDQLRPLLAAVPYPISFWEVETALFWLAERDGIFPETFLGPLQPDFLLNSWR